MSKLHSAKAAIVSSEGARRRLKRSALLLSAGLAAITLANPARAQLAPNALPTGGDVVHGSATIGTPTPSSMTVNQSTDRAVINWNTFDIGSGASVTFVQPSVTSITVNRVISGAAPSEIAGQLNANGRIAILNPNGVLFSGTANVDVGGLIASTGDIDQAAFMSSAGTLEITGANTGGEIVVNGNINISAGNLGLAAFVAPTVRNSGVITATAGRVQLGAGNAFTLDLAGDGLLQIGVPAGSALVQNNGQVFAEGGRIQMSARTAGGLIDNLVNTGTLSVDSATLDNGVIVLEAVGGSANLRGTIAANDRNSISRNILISSDQGVNISGNLGAASGTVNITAPHIYGAGKISTATALNLNLSNNGTDTSGLGNYINDALGVIGTTGFGTTLRLGAGTYRSGVRVDASDVRIDGQGVAKIGWTPGIENAIDIWGDYVTVQNLEIAGPATSGYTSFAWGSTNSRGIFVNRYADTVQLLNNNIHDIRTGIIVDGRNANTYLLNNRIDNTKSAISVQYTDGSNVVMTGNHGGTYGNEWGINLYLNGILQADGTTILPAAGSLGANTPLAEQQRLLALRAANGGMEVQNQGWSALNRTAVYVGPAGSNSNQGSPLGKLATLQAGVNAVVTGGTVHVADGNYSLGSAQLVINHGLSIIGQSQAGVVIDGRAVSANGLGTISVIADNVSLSNFTLLGSQLAGGNYGIKVAPNPAGHVSTAGGTGERVSNFAVSNVTVSGSRRAELDLNGVVGATITNFTADGQGTDGAGIQITDSANVTLSGVHTLNNNWGGVALYQSNSASGYNAQTTNINIDAGQNQFDEANGLFTQLTSTTQGFGQLNLAGFDYAIRNTGSRPDAGQFTWFQTDLAKATGFALALGAPTTSSIEGYTGTAFSNDFTVVAGLTIGAALRDARTGASINVGAGTYVENVLINKSGITLTGTNGRDLTTIQGIAGLGALGTVTVSNANNVTIDGFTILGIDNGNPGIENAALYLQGNNSGTTIRGNTITANGDLGLVSEYSATVSNLTIDGNIFNGQTFVGAAPSSAPSSQQFTTPNVSRQLVAIGGGAGGGNTSNVVFTNNQVTGNSGLNSGVTIDAVGATITGNRFASTTGGFGNMLRARGTNTSVTGNVIDMAGVDYTAGGLYIRDAAMTAASFADLLAANTLAGAGAWADASATGYHSLSRNIQGAVNEAASGAVVTVRPGDYLEGVTGVGYYGDAGAQSFGLYLYKDNITLRGVDAAGNAITDADDVAAFITSRYQAGFGAQHFISGNGVTIEGLGFKPAAVGDNKTVEVIGNAFTLRNSVIDNSGNQTAANLYIDDFNDPARTRLESFTITGNKFLGGTYASAMVVVAGGAGRTTDASNRIFANNYLSSSLTGMRGFQIQGYMPNTPWQQLYAGAVTVTGNSFDVDIPVRTVGLLRSVFAWDDVFRNNGNSFLRGGVLAYEGGSTNARATITAGGDPDIRITSTIDASVARAQNGDTVRILDGTYVLGSQLKIDRGIALVGQSQAGTILDGRTVNNGGGLGTILVAADNTTLANFTLLGSQLSGGNYGIKVQPDPLTYAPSQRISNVTISDVTVKGSRRAELDINGAVGVTLTNFTADGQGTEGAGVQITDSANVTLNGVHTLNNNWGGVALYQTNRAGGYDGQTTNINIDAAQNDFEEANGLFAQLESTTQGFGQLNLTGYNYAVRNTGHRSNGGQFTYFRTDLADATGWALSLGAASTGSIEGYTGTGYSNVFTVVQGLGIDSAVRDARSGGTINIANGTYTLAGTLMIDKSLSLVGASESGTILDASGLSVYGMRVHADNVSLSGFSLLAPSAVSSSTYGIKVEVGAGDTNGNARIDDFAIRDVSISGSRKTGLDLNSVIGATIDNVNVTGALAGNGISITDSANVLVRNTTTSGNAWGGLALYQANGPTGSNQQLTGITIEGNNLFGEANGLYLQDSSAINDVGTLSITGFDHIVRNTAFRPDGSQFTFFRTSLSDATGYALSLATPSSSSIEGWAVSAGTNQFTVVDGLSIAAAARDVRANGTINVAAGTYASGTVIGTNGVSLLGSSGAKIDASHDGDNGITITGDGVTVSGFEIFGPADQSYVSYAWPTITRGVVVANGADNVTVTSNTITGVRNGILIDGRNLNASLTGNLIDNTKSAISVQYTDGSNLTIAGNSEGSFGNEWGIITWLNGIWNGTTITASAGSLGANTPLSEQARLLALSAANGGMAVYNQGYSAANRTRAYVATSGVAGAQGSQRTLLNLQGGLDAVVSGGTVHIAGGTYDESVTLDALRILDISGTLRLNDLTFGAGAAGTNLGTSIIASGDMNIASGMVLTGDTTLLAGGALNLGSVLSPYNLTLTGNTVSLGQSVLNSLSVTGTSIVAAQVYTVGSQQYDGATTLNGAYYAGDWFTVSGLATLAGDTSITMTDGDIGIASLTGAHAFSASAGTRDVSIGQATGLASITISADEIVTAGASTSGAQSYTGNTVLNGAYSTNGAAFGVSGATTLAGDTSVTTAGGNASFGTLGGAYGLAADAGAGAIAFGAVNGLASLSATGATISTAGVSTSGNQNYVGAVSLGGSYATDGGSFTVQGVSTLTGTTGIATDGGSATLGIVAGGGNGLSLDAGSGAVTLGAASGLASLDATGATIATAGVSTDGAQTYTGTTLLAGSYSTGGAAFTVNGAAQLAALTDIATAGGAVSLFGGASGASDLGIDAGTGNVTLGTSDLGSLAIVGDTIRTHGVTSTGSQSYTGATTLDGLYLAGGSFAVADGTIIAGNTGVTTGGNASFGTIGGSGALAIDAGANAVTLGRVNGLAALAVTGGTIATGGAATNGAQSYTGATSLDGAYSTNGGAFTVNGASTTVNAVSIATTGGNASLGTVGGAGGLTVNAGTGNVTLGAVSGIASLSASGAVIATSGASTSGAQSYTGATTLAGGYATSGAGFTVNGAATLAGATSVATTGGTIGLGTIAGAGNTLAIAAGAGSVTLGAATNLGSLTASGALLTTTSVTTSGAQTYSGTLRLNGAYAAGGTFSVNGTTTLAGDSSVTTANANATFGVVGGTRALTVDAGTGTVTLGAVNGLAALSVTGRGILTNGATTAGAQSYTGATLLRGSYNTNGGAFTVTGATTLGAGGVVNVATQGGDASFRSINGPNAGLSLDAGSGDVTLGFVNGIAGLTVTGTTITTAGATTAGVQYYFGRTLLRGTYSATGFSVFGDTILTGSTTLTTASTLAVGLGSVIGDGNSSFTVNAGSDGTVLVRSVTGVTDLSLTGRAVNNYGAVTSGSQTYTGATSLAGLHSAGGDITVNGATDLAEDTHVIAGGNVGFGTVTGAQALAIEAGGNVTLGAVTGLAALSATGASITTAGASTTGAQSYTGATVLNGSYDAASFSAGATVLGSATTVTAAGNASFGTVTGGGNALTVTAGGVALGAASGLSSLTATGATIATAGVSTTGAQSYTGATSLNGAYTTNGGAFTVTGAATLADASSVTTGNGAITLGTVDAAVAGGAGLTLDAGTGTVALGNAGALRRLGATAINAGTTVLNGASYAANSLSFTGGANATVRLTQGSTTFNTSLPGGAGGAISIAPALVGTTNAQQNVTFTAGNGLTANSGDVTLGNAGTDAVRLGTMTVTGHDFTATTVKLAGAFTSVLSGSQLFSANTLDTLGNVNAQVAGNESGPIRAGGSVTIAAGGSGSGSIIAGGPVNLGYGGSVSRAITSQGNVAVTSGGAITGPIVAAGAVSLTTSSGTISGSVNAGGPVSIVTTSGAVTSAVTGGGAVSILSQLGAIGATVTAGGAITAQTNGTLTGSYTSPTTITLTSARPISVVVNGSLVTVTAPSGSVTGVFGEIRTNNTGTLIVNDQPVIGSGTADARQILIDTFVRPAGGSVSANGEIQLPVGLALGLIAPAGNGQGSQRPAVVVNNVARLGELLRIGYTAIIIQLDETNLDLEEELAGN
ncbi:filamentous hemagglutinin family protein [Sphingomonas kyeonggiensis]|uniref:beta strand repeat-containing protein n=1 Tax=Sphingomonas kyeonggiensis TaxID=1268553 RepID=UPI002785D055|nr:filamentous hemagglutinin N-terminal domain-containing protein [Sphingomonas kyeonggiensis]MDQ0251468.1 filamentous hemagglutinin family protein [Sphingomonas kyeonggiensis]